VSGPIRLVERTEVERTEVERIWPALVWAPGPGWRMLSTAVDGGGLGERCWWLNTQVDRVYHHPDPAAHVREIAAGLGLAGAGVGMLTAADVRRWTRADDQGVVAAATVGLGLPVFAAAPAEDIAAETAPRGPGTINLLVVVPVPLSDAALVNAVITATEAKTQALAEAAVPGTGTSSDALCIACPLPAGEASGNPTEAFGGPRSTWGARIARAVHAAVADGTGLWLQRHPDGDPNRPWRTRS
jgi:adenosylcobinamide hydrolase